MKLVIKKIFKLKKPRRYEEISTKFKTIAVIITKRKCCCVKDFCYIWKCFVNTDKKTHILKLKQVNKKYNSISKTIKLSKHLKHDWTNLKICEMILGKFEFYIQRTITLKKTPIQISCFGEHFSGLSYDSYIKL